MNAEIITGKDYLRLAKSESEAETLLRAKLTAAVNGPSVIYVISEREQLALLPEGAKRIYVKTDLETIKARFRARMHGTLPTPVEQMLERKHGMFDGGRYDYIYDSTSLTPARFCDMLTLK